MPDNQFIRRAGRIPAPMRAALYMVFASLSFAIMTALIRIVGQELHPIQVTFLRNLFGLAFMLPIILRVGRPILRTSRLRLHALRGVVGLLGMASWFTAVSLVPLGQAVALNFTAPLFTTVIAAVILHETVRHRRWTATIVGFIGTLVILRPGLEPIAFGAALALFSALTQSVNVTTARALARTDPPGTIVAYYMLLLTPISAIPAAFFWATPSWQALGLSVLIGGFGTLAHLSLSRALSLTDVSAIAPLDFVRLPFTVLIAFFLFAEVPDFWTIVGAAVIGVSAVYIGHREARVAQRPVAPSSQALP